MRKKEDELYEQEVKVGTERMYNSKNKEKERSRGIRKRRREGERDE